MLRAGKPRRSPSSPARLALRACSLALLIRAVPGRAAEPEDPFAFFKQEALQASGTLVHTTQAKSPAAITVITAEEIAVTPYRNLLDLIEAYVPGAIVLPHSEGRMLGLRGIIADRNLKWLLLVNGRAMNNKAHGGVYAEITNWDLSDVDRVEVIRSAGSVTYGPGAVAGIVNIITKTGRSLQGASATVKYTGVYDSKLAAISYGRKTGDLELFAHFSVAATPGQKDPRTYNMEGTLANGFGFIGTGDFAPGTPKSFPPNAFYGDFEGQPQYKVALDLSWREEWRAWARFTTSGGNMDQRVAQTRYPQGLDSGGAFVFGPPSASSEIQTRQLTLSLENKHPFGDALTLETSLSPQYQEYERRRRPELGSPYPASTPAELQERIGDRSSVWNKQSNFGEYDLLAKALARFSLDKTEAAVGYEFAYTRFGPKLGDSRADLRMGDNLNYVSGLDSKAYTDFFNSAGADPQTFGGVGPNSAVFVGGGWETYTHSLIGEINRELHPRLNLIVSGRLDKNTDTDYLFSPRLAGVWRVREDDHVKLNLQQSVRMNTGEQLLAARVQHAPAVSERLRSVELGYDHPAAEGLGFSASSFLYDLQATGFIIAGTAGGAAAGVTSLGATAEQASLRHFGLEWDARYTRGALQTGLNHSFVKLLDIKLRDGVNATSLSYADYRVPVTGGGGEVITTLSGTGHDISNWANNATKAHLSCKLPKDVTFHTDARVFWGYEGSRDMITMMERAIASSSVPAAQRESVQNALDDLKDRDVWGIDFRVNASVTKKWKDRFTLTVFGTNLITVGGAKRYQHDIGAVTLVPRAFYTEEPRTYGAAARYLF